MVLESHEAVRDRGEFFEQIFLDPTILIFWEILS